MAKHSIISPYFWVWIDTGRPGPFGFNIHLPVRMRIEKEDDE